MTQKLYDSIEPCWTNPFNDIRVMKLDFEGLSRILRWRKGIWVVELDLMKSMMPGFPPIWIASSYHIKERDAIAAAKECHKRAEDAMACLHATFPPVPFTEDPTLH